MSEEVPYVSQRFADDSEAFDVVQDGIDFLLDSVETEADVRFADKLVVPLATKAAMLKLKRLTSWAVFEYDGVIDGGQEEVMESVGLPVLEDVLKGFNGCIMAYFL